MAHTMTDDALLRVCATRLREGPAELEAHEKDALCRFHERVRAISEPIGAAFLREPVEHWEKAILAHRSHRHAWYDSLANDVSVREYATFFLENWAFPSFQKLVERTEFAQITDEGRAAVRRNIEDEQHPVPHADLMRRLIVALENKAGADLVLESYPSLVDRTLVFHYGYYCDPWHLVGSLFAMEAMAQYRMTQMKRGLDRLGFQADEIEYVRIHLHCDEHHARDWRDGVIIPSLARAPRLGVSIVEGIAAFLVTSGHYLDALELRRSSNHVSLEHRGSRG